MIGIQRAWLLSLICTLGTAAAGETPEVTVGSKLFTESVILGEMMTLLAESGGADATHVRQLGGTRILFNALCAGEIDVYAEYTGTITQEIFADRDLPDTAAVRAELLERGVLMSRPLGFNNGYAMGMRKDSARRLGIGKVSDLGRHPALRLGFSNEFLDRGDGWPALRTRYGLPHRDVRGLEHTLAYRGIESGSIDVIDLYTTDAEIRYYDLLALEDDLEHFPRYDAVLLYRAELTKTAPRVVDALLSLEGKISEAEMIAMNAAAKIDRVEETQVAAGFLAGRLGLAGALEGLVTDSTMRRMLGHTVDHLELVSISLTAALIVAVPLGIAAAKTARAGQVILAVVGIVQTIPSLALLVFMIPLFGIGATPAVVALFLYSLLPIVRNTYAGLHDIETSILESAEALGLSAAARLWWVELPLASRSILAGIKTSAVINVGTATLGAWIGAGGYGQPILTGLRLDDFGLVLQGAVPAAVMAMAAQGMFELAERVVVPKGLRLTMET